jgi:hypothetical protein
MSNLSQLSTPILHILGKVIAAELKKRDKLPVDTYTVMDECTLNVEGKVNVFPDEEYTPTASIPMKAAFALFVRYSGVTGKNAMNALVRAMKESVALGADARTEAVQELADLDRAWETVLAGLEELPKQPRKGKVTVKGKVH